MKNFIKKSAVTTLSVLGILSAMPSAFCSSNGENSMTQSVSEEEFVPLLLNDLEDGFVHYHAGSFDVAKFKEILREKDIVDAEGKYTGKWERSLYINAGQKYTGKDPRNGVCVMFMSKDYSYVIFDFCPDKGISPEDYNAFLKECGVEEVEAAMPLSGNMAIVDDFTSIKDDSFRDRKDLVRVEIPNSVTSIGNGAFNWCVNLESISIPDSVKEISPDVFDFCSKLHHIEFNGNVYDNVDSFMQAFNAYRENHKQ